MKDKAKTPQSFVRMEAARRLMDQGHHQPDTVPVGQLIFQML